MSDAKYTKEPWTTTDDGRNCPQVVDVNGRRVAMCIGQSEANSANAARIVACVNKCAGIQDLSSTVLLPADTLAKVREALESFIANHRDGSRHAIMEAVARQCGEALSLLDAAQKQGEGES